MFDLTRYPCIDANVVQKENDHPPLKKTRICQKMRNWVKVMCGRQLEALASAKAGEAAAAAAATPPASLAPESQKLYFPHFANLL